MDPIAALPGSLADRYRTWKSGAFATNQGLYERLIEEGQHPSCMIISCCDSRVNTTMTFGVDPGEFFIHRNIANFVPPFAPDSEGLGTSAAIEYAVTALKVPHLVVVGHSSCGGVAGCHAKCSGKAPQLEDPASAVGRWVELLRPAYDRLDKTTDEAAQIAALEKEGVILSLENLLTFPFVATACAEGRLRLHGLWIDIAAGELHQYDPEVKGFSPV